MEDDDQMWQAWEEEQAADWLSWFEQNRRNHGNDEKDRVATASRALPGASDQPFA
jgi:hypothetical protein